MTSNPWHPHRDPRNEREAAGLLQETPAQRSARNSTHNSTRNSPHHTQHHTTPINAERLHVAVTDAYVTGRSRGFQAGYLAGVGWGRLVGLCWGALAGSGLVAAAVKLGWLVGTTGHG